MSNNCEQLLFVLMQHNSEKVNLIKLWCSDHLLALETFSNFPSRALKLFHRDRIRKNSKHLREQENLEPSFIG